MSRRKDILELPAEAFRKCKPYSLILSMATIKDFKFYWRHTDSHWSMLKNDYYHFSPRKCCTRTYCLRTAFLKAKILTVNIVTNKYMWRRPYSAELP